MKTLICIFSLSLFLSSPITTCANDGISNFATLKEHHEEVLNVTVKGILEIIETKIQDQLTKIANPQNLKVKIPIAEFGTHFKLDKKKRVPFMLANFVTKGYRGSDTHTHRSYNVPYEDLKVNTDGSNEIKVRCNPEYGTCRAPHVVWKTFEDFEKSKEITSDDVEKLQKIYNIEQDTIAGLMKFTLKDDKIVENMLIIKKLKEKLSENGYNLSFKYQRKRVKVATAKRIFSAGLSGGPYGGGDTFEGSCDFFVPTYSVLRSIIIRPQEPNT